MKVDVGLEGETSELDDRAHLVTQDPRDLLGGLDRTAADVERLVQVGGHHLVNVGLIVQTRRVTRVGVGKDLLRRIEDAEEGLEFAYRTREVTVGVGLLEALAHVGLAVAPVAQERRVGVVAGLHLLVEQGQEVVTKINASTCERSRRIGQFGERLGSADDGAIVTVGVDSVHGLRAVGNARAGIEVDLGFSATGDVALAVTFVEIGATSPYGQRRQQVESDQTHSCDGDRLAGWHRHVEEVDRIGPQVMDVLRVADRFVVVGVARRQDHVIDADRGAVVEPDAFATADLRGDVGRPGVVADDLEVLGCVGDQGVIEPVQILAHQTTRQIVRGLDGSSIVRDPALVTDPGVPRSASPFEQTDRVRRILVLIG